jgi:ubiquinone/menaquinone biosynthesis C-methylase UbiE
MTDIRPEQPLQSEHEQYTHGYDPKYIGYLETRSAKRDAAFLLSHLRAGMSLLDCGCGPGTLTLDLAELVAPGQVVGIDIGRDQVTLAQEHARKRGVSNVSFREGTIYELPLQDQSVDVAFADTLLQHLADPAKALREVYRVLKVGGLIGVREEDTAAIVFAPSNALLDQSWDLYVRAWKHNGGDPYFARHHRAVLHEAGFVEVIGSASCEVYGTPQATQWLGDVMARYIPSNLETAVRLGWIDGELSERMGAAWKAWGQHRDAFLAAMLCEAIGWKK